MMYFKIEKDGFIPSRPWKVLISDDKINFKPFEVYKSKKSIREMVHAINEHKVKFIEVV